MKTSSILVAAVTVAIIGYWLLIYNNVVAMQKEVQDSWTQIQRIYKNRAETTPRLLAIVKSHVKNEDPTIDGVNQALETVLQIPQMSFPKNTDQLEKFYQAQQIFSKALNNLMLLAEKYPELKADPNFLPLQITFANYENQVTVEREHYMQAAQNYNSYITEFPNNLVADNLSYEPAPYLFKEDNDREPASVKAVT